MPVRLVSAEIGKGARSEIRAPAQLGRYHIEGGHGVPSRVVRVGERHTVVLGQVHELSLARPVGVDVAVDHEGVEDVEPLGRDPSAEMCSCQHVEHGEVVGEVHPDDRPTLCLGCAHGLVDPHEGLSERDPLCSYLLVGDPVDQARARGYRASGVDEEVVRAHHLVALGDDEGCRDRHVFEPVHTGRLQVEAEHGPIDPGAGRRGDLVIGAGCHCIIPFARDGDFHRPNPSSPVHSAHSVASSSEHSRNPPRPTSSIPRPPALRHSGIHHWPMPGPWSR